MNREFANGLAPSAQIAIDELTRLILQRFPEATFEIAQSIDEPDQIHLWTTVDREDPDEVIDHILDRLLQIEIEEGIPLYVIPIRTPERVLAELQSTPHAHHRRWISKSRS